MSRDGERPNIGRPHICLRQQRGFTLIELVITVAVVALVAVIALPGYQRYVNRTHRTIATSTLLALSNRKPSND